MTTKLSKGVIKVQRVALRSSQSLFTRWYDAREDRTASRTPIEDRPGEAAFSDTIGTHSGTLCGEGRRLPDFASFNSTKKNLTLSRMFAGLHPS